MTSNKPKKIFLVAGARPNFMKIFPLWREMNRFPKHIEPLIVHTGQHYDFNMSKIFFQNFNLPEPDVYLGAGSGTHAEQTAKIMPAFEKVCIEHKPDLVVVVGDVNSTMACSIVASKLLIPSAHVEAGLRSFDRTMPEEINRVVTDSISNYFFVTCYDAIKNLLKEGKRQEDIFFAGNTMIDTLILSKNKLKKQPLPLPYGLKKRGYALMTLHRPSNVDDKDSLSSVLDAVGRFKSIKFVFPVHPRTKANIDSIGNCISENIISSEPLGYPEFLTLMLNARFVITDSGGIQEETTYLRIPCLTMRNNTERPVTVKEGSNTLIGNDMKKLKRSINAILNGSYKKGKVPEKWDGKTAQRIVKSIIESIP